MKKSILCLIIAFFAFSLSEIKAQNTGDESAVYTKVDKMPEYPGGQVALVKFLSKNIKYPSKYKKEKVNGRVFVSFIIDRTGKVTQAKILKSLNEECDKEALRVIAMMPNWIPGEKDGNKVNVQFGLPVNFE
jgi:periplasmic protein TonB